MIKVRYVHSGPTFKNSKYKNHGSLQVGPVRRRRAADQVGAAGSVRRRRHALTLPPLSPKPRRGQGKVEGGGGGDGAGRVTVRPLRPTPDDEFQRFELYNIADNLRGGAARLRARQRRRHRRVLQEALAQTGARNRSVGGVHFRALFCFVFCVFPVPVPGLSSGRLEPCYKCTILPVS